MLTDMQWAMLEPLVEQCRPKGNTPLQDLRRTLGAIFWRHQNGAEGAVCPSWAHGGEPLRPSSAGLA
jgi:transposase